MSGPRVLLMTLAERTSAKGTSYLSGWLGKARLVGFKAKEPDKFGNEVWEIYAQEPPPKDDSTAPTRNVADPRRSWDASHRAERHATRTKASAAGQAILAKRGRSGEPPQGWLDDSAAAIRDPTEGDGR